MTEHYSTLKPKRNRGHTRKRRNLQVTPDFEHCRA